MNTTKKLKKVILNQFKYQTLQKYPRLFRPKSLPFISGDTYRKHSDHVFDETMTLDPKKVKNNDIVFLKSDLIEIFFNYYHQKIQKKYILITHNSDKTIGENEIQYRDEKIQHWFATNLNVISDSSLSPIPIGLENRRYLSYGRIKNFKKLSNSQLVKEPLIGCSFNPKTNPLLRSQLLTDVKKLDYVSEFSATSQLEYLSKLNNFKFNLCPEGNGLETHRFWESLILNVLPICSKTTNNINFYNIGVPMIFVDDWRNIKDIELNYFLDSSKRYFEVDLYEFANFNFWWEKIISLKN